MKINIRKSNHSGRKKGKRSEWLYVLNSYPCKKVILTRDKELIKSNPKENFYTHTFYLGEDSYFEMLDHTDWINHYNKNINYNYKKSIQIEVSNEETQQLIFEDSSILYNIENVNLEGKEYCRVNLEEYDINLYLPITTQIQCREIKNDI